MRHYVIWDFEFAMWVLVIQIQIKSEKLAQPFPFSSRFKKCFISFSAIQSFLRIFTYLLSSFWRSRSNSIGALALVIVWFMISVFFFNKYKTSMSSCLFFEKKEKAIEKGTNMCTSICLIAHTKKGTNLT